MKTTDVLALASQTVTANGQSVTLPVGALTARDVDINITAFSGATNVKFQVKRLGIDGIYYDITPAAPTNVFTGATAYSITLAAQNSASQGFGKTIAIFWTFGTPTSPSVTFSISVVGK